MGKQRNESSVTIARAASFLSETAALLLSDLLLYSCNREAVPPLRIASSTWPGYEPARDLAYLLEVGVNVFKLPFFDITLESFRNHSAAIEGCI